MLYTADSLIDAIKRNGGIPTSQRKFADSDFLHFLNEELGLTIVSKLISLQQDYFIEKETVALVANTSEYDFPLRAIGWKADSVGYLDTSGHYSKLSKVVRSQRGNYQGVQASGSPSGFYCEGTKIVTVPDIGATPTGSLQIDFIRIQNELIKTNSCGLISVVAVVGADYQMTINNVPATAGGVDVISGTNPFNIIARVATAAVAGFNISVATVDFDRAPVAGDYICQTGKTPIANIPEDYHPVLAQAATLRCLIAMNDVKGIQTAQISLANMFNSMQERSRDRVESAPTKIIPASRVLNMMR